ncbi:hypothetical protein [Kitasatospora sp. A2-31]|uniref:hypothetical protein n=1 Tax=Kitasatospora sp. A2-31 TaxID=2916414 RepID=UPI001EEF0183|nr:hypothetical protein [Kitasatospora sp. A2-31]MCG6499465.1 hypothetical protein [Kitasatospora sp. A2-31]
MTAQRKTPTAADILAKVKPRTATVTLYLDGEAAGRIAQLEAQFADLADWQPESLADSDPRRAIAQEIAGLQDRIRDSAQDFVLRALPAKAWSDLLALHPGRHAQELYNPTTLPAALVPACLVEPAMTPEEYEQLAEVLNQGQRDELELAAWQVNNEAVSVPFSLAASAHRHSTGER